MTTIGVRRTWIAGTAFVVVLCLLLPSGASAQGVPQGCGYGTGGPNASNLCWFDMSAYDDARARSPAGQPMAVTLPGGYRATFTLTSRPVPGAPQHSPVASRAVPIETRFAFGTAGYVGVPGRPALYSSDIGDNGVALTLGDIRVTDAAGVPVTGYSFVIADTENNINGERFTWTSDKPLELIGVLNPTSPRGCRNGLTGLGTTSVTCIGQGGEPGPGTPRPWYDDVIVGADTPSTIGLSMRTFGRSGVAFAIMTSKIQVTKRVVGRVRSSDSFDVGATSPEGSTLATASTGSESSATTGELTVLPRTNGSSYTLTETATAGSGTRLADYSQSWSCTNDGVVEPALPAGGGTSTRVSPAPGDDIECTVTNTQLPADLSLVKSGSPSPVVPGREQAFSLVVSNGGPSRATNVVVSDVLPDELAFVSASPGCGEAGGTVTCTVASLEPGASKTFTITGRVASSLDHCLANAATVSSATPDADPDDDRSTICVPLRGEVDLAITKTASASALPVGGGQVMYTLVVENDGPSDATGVTVTDPVPAGLTLMAAEPSQGSCSTTASGVSCDLGRLADGGSAQVLVTTRTWATPGGIANAASVTGDQVETDPEDNRASATVSVAPAPPPPSAATFDLHVDKRASASRPVVGQPVRYRIVVANRGSGPAPGVTVADTLNAPVGVISVRTTAGSCGRRIPIACELGTIAAGASATVTVVARHRTASHPQRNAVSATGSGTDASPATNLDTTDVRARKVRVRLTKVASRAVVRAGEPFGYRIRVRNPTRGEARDVRVCDRLPSGLSYAGSTPLARRSGRQRCWTIQRLRARSSRTLRLTVRAARGAIGRRTNRAIVSSPDSRRARARSVVRVRGVATPVTG